jgi:hypothetical protein
MFSISVNPSDIGLGKVKMPMQMRAEQRFASYTRQISASFFVDLPRAQFPW